MTIELNRGVTSRKHGSGMRVYVYDDEPGNFYDERGRRISQQVAQEAGFDVKGLIRQQDKRNRLEAFKRELDREFTERERKVDEISDVDDGIEIRPLKGGGFSVHRDGSPVSGKSMTFDEAVSLVESMRAEDGADTTDDEAPAAGESGLGAQALGRAREAQGESEAGSLDDLI